MTRHVAQQSERLLSAVEPFRRFFTESTWSKRTQPGCDFVAGNPQDLPLSDLVATLMRHTEPKDKDWFAYKTSEPVAQAAAAEGARRASGIPIEPVDVTMTTGAFAGLALALHTILDPGDEVLFCSPPWFFYEALILSAGGTPVRIRMRPPAFDLPLTEIEATLSPRTRAIIVNSPHNPTGRIYPEEDLNALGTILLEASGRAGRPIYLLSDESYRKIVYPPYRHISPAAFYPWSFLIYTYGKQLLAPGERIGYLALRPDLPDREDVRAAIFAQQIVLGWTFPNAILQYALPELEPLSIDLEHLTRKRDRMVAGLREAGYECSVPEATFYLLPDSPDPDDAAFAELLAAEGVYVLPGSLVDLPGSLRLSLTANDAMIERALPVFARLRTG